MPLFLILAIVLIVTLAMVLAPVFKKQHAHFIIAVGVIFFLAAFGLYRLTGSPEIVPLLAARSERLAQVKTIIVQRSADVKTNPDNLGAWVELGESFMETGQFSAASGAFKRAVLIADGNPTILMAYAQSLIAQENDKVTDDAQKALEMVLLQQPDNGEAHYWLIVRQLQDGHTQDAMAAMKALYHSLPDDSPVKVMIDKQIGRK